MTYTGGKMVLGKGQLFFHHFFNQDKIKRIHSKISLILCLFLFISLGHLGSALALIREVSSMKEVFPIVDQETLLIFDIDNTLIEPVGNLGSDQWFYYLYKIYKFKGLSEKETEAKANQVWNKTQSLIQVRAVENETPEFILEKQKKGIPMMAVTARSLNIADQTLKQLGSVHIQLKDAAVYKNDVFLPKSEINSSEDALYKNGILFVGEGNKGEILVRFMQKAHLQPKKIVFVDDKQKHVLNMEKALSSLKIPYFGFRYGALDTKVKKYNDLMAEVLDKKTARLFLMGELE